MEYQNSVAYPWFTPVLNIQYLPTDRLRFGARAEYFEDQENIILASEQDLGAIFSWSFNIDFAFHSSAKWRTEIRQLLPNSFVNNNLSFSNGKLLLTTGLALSF